MNHPERWTAMIVTIGLLTSLQAFNNTPPKIAGGPDAIKTTEVARQATELNELAFEENKGQVRTTHGEAADHVRFRLSDGNMNLFLLEAGIAYQFSRMHTPNAHLDRFADPTICSNAMEQLALVEKESWTETFRMDMTLEGANTRARTSTEDRSLDLVHYYNHDALDVHTYRKVTYHEVYPNIDWVVYMTQSGIKYDFVVHPGGDPDRIRLHFSHHEALALQPDGSLLHENRLGRFIEEAPISFQNGVQVNTQFVLEGDQLRFAIEDYDRSRTLTIDPSRVWGTYYGGSSDDVGTSSAVDGLGNIFLAGWTASTNSIAQGGHQISHGGSTHDAFLVKFNAAGTRLWATYYGGTGNDNAFSCAVDAGGNVYLAGSTFSTNNIAADGHQNSKGEGAAADAFLAKFNGDGTRLWATYYGGIGQDEGRGCTVNADGSVYLCGTTSSSADIASAGFQMTRAAVNDAFLVKFNSNGARIWGTYYGGSQHDYGSSCTTDAAGNVYLAAYGASPSNIASSGHQNTFGGGTADAYLVKFTSSGARAWATYYGGSGVDDPTSCATDGAGNVYLAGRTASLSGIGGGGHQNTFGGGAQDAFLIKFTTNGTRVWGTYYGGSGDEYGHGCQVDNNSNVYLCGRTSSSNAIAQDGYQNTNSGAMDAFLAVFSTGGSRQWGTFYGGNAFDAALGCAVDGSGDVYLVGQTGSTTMIANGGHQNNHAGVINDAFLVKLRGAPTVTTGVISSPSCAGNVIAVPYTASGEFDTGNMFSAELSDAAGSFVAPVVLGGIISTTSGTINGTIPLATAPGNAYRIRVVANAPITVGSENGVNIIVVSPQNFWYADVDGDGYGDPSSVIQTCDALPPVGFVANNNDLCPSDALKQAPGTCGCGVADTDSDNDGIPNCIDNCPNTSGVYGSLCDADPGPGIVAGTLNSTCTCTPTCTQNVTVELRTDALSSQASWQILDQNSNAVICQFSVPIDGITTPITENCCLPVGCYRLRVQDSGGDGFVSGGITGGYQLRESGINGRRIIDNFENFTTGGVSALANTYDNGAFCVPMSDVAPIFSSCDKLDWVNYKFIVASADIDVTNAYANVATRATTGYEFWFYDVNGGYSYRRFRSHSTSDGFGSGATRACHLKINRYSAMFPDEIPQNVLLNVRIRGRVAGVNQAFGPTCLFKIDPSQAACPKVNLQDNLANTSDFSCGVTRAWGGSNSPANRIVANPPQFQPAPLAGGTGVRFQFRFRIPGEGVCIVRPPQASPTLHLNWNTGTPLLPTKTYEVEVRVSKDLGATWCVDAPSPACDPSPVTTWGKICNVTISSGTMQGGASSLTAQGNGSLTMYPNPNRGDQLFISLTQVETNVNTVSVDIYDMTGKRVSARTLAIQDGYLNTSIELSRSGNAGGDLAGGMYLVNITAGTKTYSERLVIQP